MTRFLTAILLSFQSAVLHAGLIDYFKDEEGHTNWQYVANWSSGVLILLLTVTVISLFFAVKRAHRSNRALEAIRAELEVRVRDRTATLNESNRLLKQSNELLEREIQDHRETTARLRSSESYIKNILESMPLMLIGLEKDGKVTQWNRSAEEIAGISAASALGKNLWEIYPTITVSPRQVEEARRENRTITIKHSQRGRSHFDITIYPLRDHLETGVVILIDDVTKQILAENMLIHRDKMSSMGELAATMAYDINAPLQAMVQDVQTVASLLRESENGAVLPGGGDRPELTGLLDDATAQGSRAAAVISNLLAFARGRGEEKRPGDITEIIDHALELAEHVLAVPAKLRFRDITIERDYEPNLPPVPCYESELQQVFLSLFRHACHALGQVDKPDHQPTIRIQAMECYGALWIKVQHNGVGLTEEEQQHIFEPFFSHSPENPDYAAGQRLSFSHFIITEHHQGQMAVTSDVDIGTTFHMQIQLD
jgi:PAS domain S-box-containing protein